jgi:hypothetical protein
LPAILYILQTKNNCWNGKSPKHEGHRFSLKNKRLFPKFISYSIFPILYFISFN